MNLLVSFPFSVLTVIKYTPDFRLETSIVLRELRGEVFHTTLPLISKIEMLVIRIASVVTVRMLSAGDGNIFNDSIVVSLILETGTMKE